MSETITIAMEVKKADRRLLFVGPVWDDWDLEFCIHGEKLRWTCDECKEFFGDE